MPDPAKHEERAQKSADALRAMLTALATAGIGAAYAVRGDQDSDLWRGAVACFVLALACVVTSWFLVKHRELRRRDAATSGESAPTFPSWKRSWTWDRAGALLLFAGVVLLAFGSHR